VVVTFDDGYANNLHNAKPLLEHYNIPATVFVTSGHIGQEREFWWDELERVLLQPKSLPEKLCLKIDGNTYQWELGEAVDYSEDEYRRDRNQKAWESQPGSRLFFYYSVWQRLQPLQESNQLKALDEILAWADTEPIARSTHRTLTPEEVCTLGQGELVEIGAHTVTHPFLSAHSLAFQRDEIQRSKAHLEALLERSVTSFAYPFGGYTEETVPLMPEAEFTCACSTVEDIVWRKSDCFQFPRFGVEDWNGEEFAQRLLSWLGD
jgi:peptidoglycan/xylan/chitin deacetylase (PgdA/CDA1 family)